MVARILYPHLPHGSSQASSDDRTGGPGRRLGSCSTAFRFAHVRWSTNGGHAPGKRLTGEDGTGGLSDAVGLLRYDLRPVRWETERPWAAVLMAAVAGVMFLRPADRTLMSSVSCLAIDASIPSTPSPSAVDVST